ncbi:hypothetical protein [Aestuariirhabdus litorea]|uniref:Uncharacterized protein n=1 Tax=Aestuariirhabdus litorea TaxID=2528527 RepID=A0A3P3VQX6_9GAMM|nr:hypothetical protein [Aestuariirhabdus litorea]RRJ85201.1 hypothetical protein D0544_09080 [Aestuariirhabdus litorea]RWW98422.1 hypothetical protein DZC74_09065 [Endozoicomonadaceae bacterium GTF-13]
MRLSLPVTDRELEFDTSQRIISTTDLKGRVTPVKDDVVKISGFSDDLGTNPRQRSLAKAVLSKANSLGVEGIDEGVEAQWHSNFLKPVGCHRIQDPDEPIASCQRKQSDPIMTTKRIGLFNR